MRFTATEERHTLARLIASPISGECLLSESSVGITPALDTLPTILDAGVVTGFKRCGSSGCRTGGDDDECPCSGDCYLLDAKKHLPDEADDPYLGHEMLLCFCVGSRGLVKLP